MDKYLKQLIKDAKNLRLHKEDKLKVRENLYTFMQDNPLPITPPVTFSTMIRRHAIAFVALLLVISGSGISFAAEGSAPGDTLYSIKKINERTITNLVFTERAKINWELKRVGRRLIEAEKLAAKENLVEERMAVIEERFEEHTQAINKRIAALQLDSKFQDAAELSSNFETSLKAHDKILTRIIRSKTNALSAAEPLVLNIRAQSNTAERARASLEDSVLSAPVDEIENDNTIQGKAERIEKRVERIHNILDRVVAFLADNIKERILGQTDFVDELLKQARDYIEEGEYGKAFIVLQQANRISGELEIILNASEHMFNQIDPEKTISIKDCKGSVQESFPRRCVTPDGTLIIKEDLEIKIPQ